MTVRRADIGPPRMSGHANMPWRQFATHPGIYATCLWLWIETFRSNPIDMPLALEQGANAVHVSIAAVALAHDETGHTSAR